MKPNIRLSLFAAITFGLALGACARPAHAQGYWVWNGTSMTRVHDDNTSQFVVRQWQVWLYYAGKPTGGKDNWDMITGSTSSEVMQKLKRDQEWELNQNKFNGKGRVPNASGTTWHNPLGPIAVVERPKPKPTPTPKPAPGVKPRPAPTPTPATEARWGDPDFNLGQQALDADLQRKRDAWGGIVEGKENLDTIRNILTGADNPFGAAGGNVSGLIDAYIDAAYKLQRAKRMLDQVNNPAIAGIDGVLGEFMRDLDKMSADLAAARGRIQAIPVNVPQVEPLPAVPVTQPAGTMTPEQAKDLLQHSLGQWYQSDADDSDRQVAGTIVDFSNPNRITVEGHWILLR